ncbi:MAG: tryptophan synthase subunit alpha [Candidatus Omnitrophica bacterium]|nr:tryptophan synthase subunit alpha [Candidatus Omnitrophota bacterium]
MNRIDQTFQQLRRQKKKAFIAFISAGDPDLKTTYDLVLALEKAGADIIELGVPFSDPMADGPTIQASSMRALHKGASLKKILDLVKRLRLKTQISLCLMTYYNIIFHHGEKKFVQDAKACGVDGVIVPDLPAQEAKTLRKAAQIANLATIFFVAPTTSNKRIKPIAQASKGFIYYISLTGVTGARQSLPSTITADLKRIKKVTDKPVCVGFGVSTSLQVKAINRVADGVIVGSAIVRKIEENSSRNCLIENVAKYVKSLVTLCHCEGTK